ncbi:transglycosylase SLT domain-containing protein [Leptolyngbya cf. ectocarpi LEGE 11479]|uniref:Transglycosylase SLT domain-containing protein n=1 Tax=Leptolyngbya cf. ectocarpi LEGE 11479 TaxID=1828722 RepID=A0A929FAS5_LEPEC|nr:transglycosylase SLT domain-containing protein [Leptolyngbya ectocarpi]MBE9068587.1 transglycosylase SLT domain-containing protein [Leptolyngbya cf. ectocarpi LEGE 11479]
MGKRLIELGKAQLPLLLLGGISLASLGLIVFFSQVAKQVLPTAPSGQSQPQQTDSTVFRLALQPPETRTDMLRQMIATDQKSQDTYLASYLLATDLLAQGNANEALTVLDNQDPSNGADVLAPYVLLRRGQAQVLAGEAPTSWNELLANYDTHSATAEARYELGKQDPAQWQELVTKHPSHPRAVEVAMEKLKTGTSKELLLLVAAHGLYHDDYEASLDRLTQEYGQELTPEQWQTVGFGYWENLQYGKASEAYAQAPTSPTSLYRTARGAQIARKKVAAIAAYQKLAQTYPSAPETGLGLIKLADSLPDKAALAALDQAIKTFPDRAGEALLKKANILENLKSPTSAKDARTSVLSQYSDSEAAAELRLSRAHKAAKANDLATARQLAEDLVAATPQSELAAEASFWSGKWSEQQGQAGRPAYERTVAQYPESYFAWRSAVMLGWEVGNFESVRYLAPELRLPQQRDSLPAGSDTLQLLYRLGQDTEAWSLWQTEFSNAQDPSVAEQFTDGVMRVGVGDNLDGIFMLTSLAWRDKATEKAEYQQLKTTATYWQTVYPFPFFDLIQAWSQERQLNPLLVTALMRQESRFEPKIRSVADAIGLMQVIPSTADWVLTQIGESNDNIDAKLENPNENIKLGTWYLDYTHREYSNNSMFAVASYNAGPGNVADWIAKGYGDPDVFAQNIPFPETHGYVEAVFGGYWNYLRLYNPAINRQVAQYTTQAVQ